MNRIVCDNYFFKNPRDRLGLGYRLCSFSGDIHYWNGAASAEERECLLHFLDGGGVIACEVCEYWLPDNVVNSLSMELMHKARTKEGFLDFIFGGYKDFSSFAGFGLLDVRVQVLQDSVQVLRIFRGCRKDVGRYTKYTLSYKVRFRLEKPVKDLTDAELVAPFRYEPLCRDVDGERCWAQAFKAVLQRPGRLFCSKQDMFITQLPLDTDGAEEIFKAEFLKRGSLDLTMLAKFGKDFALSPDDRKNLEETEGCISFYCYNGKMFTWDILGSSVARRGAHTKFRLPLIEKGPHLYVKNCRKGIEVMDAHIKKWQAAGRAESVNFKFGCFQWETIARGNLQELVDYCQVMIRYLKGTANFVEYLRDDGSCPLKERLMDVVLEQVKLDPLTYCDHFDPAVSRLATYLVNGEY